MENYEEKQDYTATFGCSSPFRFITNKGFKTMLPGKIYDEKLNEIGEEPKMNWTNINDEMPKMNQLCLLFQTFPEGTMFNCLATPLPRCNIWIGGLIYNNTFQSAHHIGQELKYITHWMPLPESPYSENK